MRRRTIPLIVLALVSLTAAGCTAVTTPSAEPSQSLIVQIDPEPTYSDPWIHHFDDEAATHTDSAEGVAWGSFGTPGRTSPIGNTFGSAAAGEHRIIVQCAGPANVTVTVAPADSPQGGKTKELPCSAAVTFQFTTTSVGIDVTMDSHGAVGAWLMDVSS
jgi:hypothetical protein